VTISRAVPNIRTDRPAETRDEEWEVRRFMLRDPSGTVVNVLSHIP
jgi:hypothetical protein